jgi:hypothetical protein
VSETNLNIFGKLVFDKDIPRTLTGKKSLSKNGVEITRCIRRKIGTNNIS